LIDFSHLYLSSNFCCLILSRFLIKYVTRGDKMTAVVKVREYLKSIPAGKPFPSKTLRPFATTDNIRQILNRLVKTEELKRVARGVFIKPKHSAIVGEVPPSVIEVAEIIAKSTGEIINVHGAEAARKLELTTQVPMRPSFYTSGSTRTLKIGNMSVKLKHVNPNKLIGAGSTAGLVLSALRYLGKENVTIAVIKKIKKNITLEELKSVLNLIEHMPSWMADVFYRYQCEEKDDR
jgi:hypothetical protein